MSANTGIEWTDRTWNPLTGCTKVSPGCDHCYAKTMHERFHGPGSFDTVTLHPERLDEPSRWRKPARVFVNSMSDLFHQDVPDEYIARVFAVMAINQRHTFQVLTKRHARMRSLLRSPEFWVDVQNARVLVALNRGVSSMEPMPWPLPNVWLGVSVETQQWADIRIPALLDTPAAVRFLSCEPLLGPVNWQVPTYRAGSHDYGIDWVIVGGESGPGARPMHPDWARSLRDQCVAAGVPFLFKQWGAWAPASGPLPYRTQWGYLRADGKWEHHRHRSRPVLISRASGKKAAGRVLDGRTWDEYPEAVNA